MEFIRVVEVFPPLFPASPARADPLGLQEKTELFVKGVRGIRSFADVFLVADVKDTNFLKLSTVEAASILQEHLGVEAAPVIVLRDMNRPRFLSTVLTAIAKGLRSVMVAWGDDFPSSAGAANIRDFPSLGEAIHQASLLAARAGASTRFFAPVDLDRLARPGGAPQAKRRLKSGADLLLAQPPTTDAGRIFDRHVSLLTRSSLADRVLLGVFPFRDATDVRRCEKYFGWNLPESLHRVALRGGSALVEAERNVVRRLKDEKFPGVYVATRGEPSVAERLLS